FDLSTALPTIVANGSDVVTLAVRATDTGGNSSTSGPIVMQLVADTIRPEILSDNVSDIDVHGPSFRAIRATFSEAMDENSINRDTVQLIGPAGVVNPVNIQFRNRSTEVQITYDTLALGDYDLIVDAKEIKDRAGNTLSDQSIAQHFRIAAFTNQWV